MSVHDPLPRYSSIFGSAEAGHQPPPPEAGDPGPTPPPASMEPADIQLRELGDMAKRGVNYQFATLALLAGYASMFRHVSQALDYLRPGDLDASPGLRDELANAISSADRALHAPLRREAAE